jgi:hypothetical protein
MWSMFKSIATLWQADSPERQSFTGVTPANLERTAEASVCPVASAHSTNCRGERTAAHRARLVHRCRIVLWPNANPR